MESAQEKSSRQQRDYLNIIYFVDSDSTRSFRIPLNLYRVLIVATITLILGWILALAGLVYYVRDNETLVKGMVTTKQYLFDYQTRFDNIFEYDAPPATLTLVQEHSNQGTVPEEAMIQSASTKAIAGYPVEVVDLRWEKAEDDTYFLRFGIRNLSEGSRSVGRVWAKVSTQEGKHFYFPTTFRESEQPQMQHLPGYAISKYKSFEFHYPQVESEAVHLSIHIYDELGGSKAETFSLPSGKRIP